MPNGDKDKKTNEWRLRPPTIFNFAFDLLSAHAQGFELKPGEMNDLKWALTTCYDEHGHKKQDKNKGKEKKEDDPIEEETFREYLERLFPGCTEDVEEDKGGK